MRRVHEQSGRLRRRTAKHGRVTKNKRLFTFQIAASAQEKSGRTKIWSNTRRLTTAFRRAGVKVIVIGVSVSSCSLLLAPSPALATSYPAHSLCSDTAEVTWSDKLVYKAQLLISSDVRSRIAVLVASLLAVCVAGGVGFQLSGIPLRKGLFQAYTILSGTPGADATGYSGRAAAVAQMCFLLGLVSFSLFLGIVTDAVSSQLRQLKTGNFRVCEHGHTVIAGNHPQQTEPLLRQLAIMQSEGGLCSNSLRRVVVLNSEMSNELPRVNTRMEQMKVIWRTADPSSEAAFKKVSASTARNIIVMHPERFQSSHQTDRKANTVMNIRRSSHSKPSVVIQRSCEDERPVDIACQLQSHSLQSLRNVYVQNAAARILAQSSVEPGLSNVISQIIIQSKNHCELYESLLPSHLHKCSFEEVADSVQGGTAIGFQRHERTVLAPLSSEPLDSGSDTVIVLAGNERFGFANEPPAREESLMQLKQQDDLVDSCFSARKTLQREPLTVAMIGAEEQLAGDVLHALDEFLPHESRVLAAPSSAGSQVQLDNQLPSRVSLDVTNSKERLGLEQADRVIVLNPQKDDNRVVSDLLCVSQDAPKASVAAELVTNEGSKRASQTIAALDVVNPNEIEAGAIVQALGSTGSFNAMRELLVSAGKELHLSEPVTLPAGTTLQELRRLAHQYNMALCGFKRTDTNGARLNPSQSETLPDTPIQLVLLGDTI